MGDRVKEKNFFSFLTDPKSPINGFGTDTYLQKKKLSKFKKEIKKQSFESRNSKEAERPIKKNETFSKNVSLKKRTKKIKFGFETHPKPKGNRKNLFFITIIK